MSGCCPKKQRRRNSLSAETQSLTADPLPSRTFLNLLNGARTTEKDPLSMILQNDEGISYFEKFLSEEHSIDFLSFWKDIELYKKISDSAERQQMAQKIVNEYLTPTSPKEVSVPGSLLLAIFKSCKARLAFPIREKVTLSTSGENEISEEIFNPVQSHAFEVMRCDSFIRFMQRYENARKTAAHFSK